MAVTVANASAITFPAASSGSETATHMSIGYDSSGGGVVIAVFTLTPNVAISTPIQPIVSAGQGVLTISGTGLGDPFVTDLMELVFENSALAGLGDVTGPTGSSSAGSVYAALHTADPGRDGVQTTNECTYGSYARVAIGRTGAAWTITNT